MAATVQETTFTKAFIHLLSSNADKVLADDYVADASTLGPKPLVTLPDMPQAKKKPVDQSTQAQNAKELSESTVEVTLKSIKEPKFTITLPDISTTTTVLRLKEQILGDPDGPFADIAGDEYYEVSNIRCLVKGKVVPDLKTVGEYEVEGALNMVVMVSAPTGKRQEKQSTDIDQALWSGIKQVVIQARGEQGVAIFHRLQAAWNTYSD